MDTLQASHTPLDGPVTPEIAFAAAGTQGEGGRDLSDDERRFAADRILEAARANASWRDSRLAASMPIGEAIRLASEPVIFVPGADDPDSYPGTVTDKDGRQVHGVSEDYQRFPTIAPSDDDDADREQNGRDEPAAPSTEPPAGREFTGSSPTTTRPAPGGGERA